MVVVNGGGVFHAETDNHNGKNAKLTTHLSFHGGRVVFCHV